MAKNLTLNRRQFVGGAAAAGLASTLPAPAVWAQSDMEIVHWSWLAASDGEVWAQDDRRLQRGAQGQGLCRSRWRSSRRSSTSPRSTPPRPPAARRISAGARRACAPRWRRTACIVPLDDLVAKAGLDLADFDEFSIKQARYPKYDNGLFMIPMDLMSLQPEVNTDHLKEAGLDPEAFPHRRRDAARLGREDDEARGRHRHPLRHHDDRLGRAADGDLGHRRGADGLQARERRPEGQPPSIRTPASQAMQWVLDLFDKQKVSTRDVTDRYKAFGTGQGSIFWTGPWTLNGYVEQKLPFRTYLFPKIGASQNTYFEMGGMEFYTQSDPSRATRPRWRRSSGSPTTVFCGRRSAAARARGNRSWSAPDYKTAGHPWDVRGAFVDGMSFATEGEIPVLAGPEFTIYSAAAIFWPRRWRRCGPAWPSRKRRWQQIKDAVAEAASTPGERAQAMSLRPPLRRRGGRG